MQLTRFAMLGLIATGAPACGTAPPGQRPSERVPPVRRESEPKATKVPTEGFCRTEDIQRVVTAGRPGVLACHAEALVRDATLQGKVVVLWRIGLDGTVQWAKIRESTMNDVAVERCITEQVEAWVFPRPNGGLCQISYPFLFEPPP